jgi:hypothetical protein
MLLRDTSATLKIASAAAADLPEEQYLLEQQKLSTDKSLIYLGTTLILTVSKEYRIHNNNNNNNTLMISL